MTVFRESNDVTESLQELFGGELPSTFFDSNGNIAGYYVSTPNGSYVLPPNYSSVNKVVITPSFYTDNGFFGVGQEYAESLFFNDSSEYDIPSDAIVFIPYDKNTDTSKVGESLSLLVVITQRKNGSHVLYINY